MTIEDARIWFARQESRQPDWTRDHMYVDGRCVGILDERHVPARRGEPAHFSWLVCDLQGRAITGQSDAWREFDTREAAIAALRVHAGATS